VLKFEAYGITSKLLVWFRSFLMGRDQCVKVDGTLSFWEWVSSDVPQGSVLGPLLFVLYVNELLSLVASKLLMFADDIKLYHTIHSPLSCRGIVMYYLNGQNIIQSFNVAKCKAVHIGSALYDDNYCLNETQLGRKYLRLWYTS